MYGFDPWPGLSYAIISQQHAPLQLDLEDRFKKYRRTFCTKSPPVSSSNIDEFRAKEEKLEEEFNKEAKLADQKVLFENSQQTENDEKVDRVRADILNASLKYAETMGWTKEAITKGAESIGYPGVTHGMFPRGGIELVEHFYSVSSERLVDWMKTETGGLAKVQNPKEFVIKAVEMRLRMLEPYLTTWPQAIAVMSLPQNAVRSLANLLTLVDDICYFSGDRAVDFGWYTRRVGLAGIYKLTELYFLQDKSIDHQSTLNFLRKRMEDAVLINSVLEQSEDVTQNMQKAVTSAFTTARNILGLNFQRR